MISFNDNRQGPVPSSRQLAWHQMNFYGFIHFSMSTFTDREWGLGDEDPQDFNPTELDARQWAKVARDAGMRGLILTCKHHDGFCLWPSAHTEHSVKNSPWRNGKGDLVREVSEACCEFGLQFGVYLSPWDRNHPDYGKPEYVEYYRNQLRELLTDYGPVFELWWDGANGGGGYYGGAGGVRRIDRSTYYDWPGTLKIVRELQPQAVVFSDGGPDVRWVGNESGSAAETNWCTFNADGRYPGYSPDDYNPKADLGQGHERGTHWMPAEVDVSIRPGWFYHRSEDDKVRSPVNLLELYFHSIGRGANLLLNLPPDRRGLIHETDVKNLMDFAALRDRMLEPVVYACSGLTAVPGGTDGEYVVELPGCDCGCDCNLIGLTEDIAYGQRVKSWTLEGDNTVLATGTTIGPERLAAFPKARIASSWRLRLVTTGAEPHIGGVRLLDSPVIVKEPVITRDRRGIVSIDRGNGVNIRYSTDGSEVTTESPRYDKPFEFGLGGTVKAAVFADDNPGALINGSFRVARFFGLAKVHWNIADYSSEQTRCGEYAANCIDSDFHTVWSSNPARAGHPHFVAIDLGKEEEIAAIGYLPRQDGSWGVVDRCSLAVSLDGKKWISVAEEVACDNIAANPIMQVIRLGCPRKARFFKFTSLGAVNNSPHASVAELEVFSPEVLKSSHHK